jgi:rhodanese-related sulfurtransferase
MRANRLFEPTALGKPRSEAQLQRWASQTTAHMSGPPCPSARAGFEKETPMPALIYVPALRELLKSPEPPIVLDVRRPKDFSDSPSIIPGATRRLPESVDSWADELPTNRQVVAYCVHGRQVSQGVVAHLEQRGIKASFLEGGIEQWRADGGALLAAAPDASIERTSPIKPAEAFQIKR